MHFKDTPSGHLYDHPDYSIFFGNKNFDNSDHIFNNNKLIFGHQTHDAELINVETKDVYGAFTHIESADGMATDQTHRHLSIYTADCVPCFILSKTKLISLHLGWRSLHKGLFDLALNHCSDSSEVFIGPHITQESFEVRDDVISSFQQAPDLYNDKSWFKPRGAGKHLVSLERILQIKAQRKNLQLTSLKINTFTSDKHHSFRRDNKIKGRNISFAFLKNKV